MYYFNLLVLLFIKYVIRSIESQYDSWTYEPIFWRIPDLFRFKKWCLT